jgi:TetR/AcrR family transcriptional regulator, transcriptional repressor for nem operon
MQKPSPKAEELLDLAERYVRSVGYNGFSFRDLADDAGIKSASVHYHFPTKERLAAAVARRYGDRFFAALGPADDTAKSPLVLMHAFVDLFRHALREDGRMCLFCVLGAEFSALPEEVQNEVRRFVSQSTAWLIVILRRSSAHPALSDVTLDAQARTILATLEGAMIVARASDDLVIFDRIVEQLMDCGLMPDHSFGSSQGGRAGKKR